jgi:hypothetical protein
LKEWTEGDEIVYIEGSPVSDEQLVLILTKSGKLWLIEFEVRRRQSDDINETQAKKGNKKYKDMIKRYEYFPKQVK